MIWSFIQGLDKFQTAPPQQILRGSVETGLNTCELNETLLFTADVDHNEQRAC